MPDMVVSSSLGRRCSRCPRLSWRSTAWVYICAIVLAVFLSGLNCLFNPNGLLGLRRDASRRAEPCWVSSFLPSSDCSCDCDEVSNSVFEMKRLQSKLNMTDVNKIELTRTKVVSVMKRIFRQSKNPLVGKDGTTHFRIIREVLAKKADDGSLTKDQEQMLLRGLEKYSQMDKTVKGPRKNKGGKKKGVRKQYVSCHKEDNGTPSENKSRRNTTVDQRHPWVDNARVVRDSPVLMYKDETGQSKVVAWESAIVNLRDSYNLTAVKEPFLTWTPNLANKKVIRKQLQECCMSRDMVASQLNVEPGTKFERTFDPDLSYTVTKNFYGAFPLSTPFPREPFRTCAVVGNSGILRRSSCGSQIDSADYVFRINLPPMTGKEAHALDVGTKTNLTTAISSLVKKLQKYAGREGEALKHLEPFYGLLFIRKPAGYLLAVDQVLQAAGRPLRIVYQHPDHYRAVNNFWNQRDLHITITTGLYIISSALTLCDEVTAYGFWPFPFTELGEKVPFHYFVSTIFLPPKEFGGVYDMPGEFMKIRDLHMSGVIRVVTDKCEQ